MSKFLFEELALSDSHNASTFKKAIFAIIIFLCVLIIGYWLDIRNLQKDLFIQRNNHVQIQQQADQFQQQTADFDKQRAHLTQLQAQFNDIQKQMPVSANSQSIINNVLQAGQSTGIQFNSIQPQPFNKQDFFTLLPLQITITGNYPQLINFLNLLNQLKIILTIPEFSLTHANPQLSTAMDSTPNNSDKLMMNMAIDIYLAP